MAERNSRLGISTRCSDGSSASESLGSLVAIFCTSAKELVKRTLDGAKKTDDLDDEEDSHKSLLCAVCLSPVSSQVVPEGMRGRRSARLWWHGG